jgi:DtxR family transcriptional regulator, Mn-dependent transcriptional regulator
MSQHISLTEENYLKEIFHLSENSSNKSVNTNALADVFKNKAASVTDMIRKLSEKKMVDYKKYQGVKLTFEGRKMAIQTIRKHRLWEVFLVNHLGFGWDEIHTIAEQLEHIHSDDLIDRLDKFLKYPSFDPHGDPIPNAKGIFPLRSCQPLSTLKINENALILHVLEDSQSFLAFLNSVNIKIGTAVKVIEKFEFDDSLKVQIDEKEIINLSDKVAKMLWVS